MRKSSEPTHLDLFSGIGGFALAAQWAGFRTIGFCEIDKYCQKVLAKNFLGYTAKREDWRLQQSEFSPNAGTGSPIFADIFDLDGRDFSGVDLITGGFPCQPFSVAGKRGGAGDDRAIWPQMLRVISEARPDWVLGENVPGIISMELDNVLSDLERIGYATRPFVIPACGVDARHRRDRVWIVARDTIPAGISETVADPMPSRGFGQRRTSGTRRWWSESERQADRNGWKGTDVNDVLWLPEPDVGGTFDGLSRWLDRYGGLNGASKIKFASEAVCPLWDRVLAQSIREQSCISPEKVLFAFVCKLKKWQVDEAWIQLASKKALETEVRGVRFDSSAYCPSCRSRHSEQHAREHPDFVQVLSRLLARHAEKAWTEYRRSDAAPILGWETGYARVAHGVGKRVGRLKGLGNAVVPQVAYEILKVIREQL